MLLSFQCFFEELWQNSQLFNYEMANLCLLKEERALLFEFIKCFTLCFLSLSHLRGSPILQSSAFLARKGDLLTRSLDVRLK